MTARLHYQIVGEGPPLVVLHGLFGTHRNWFSIARQLAENRQVIAVDLRNHGASEHHDSMSYPEMAADLEALISELGHERVDLMGHSMGGKTAMVMALLHPERVGRLIIVDIAPVDYQLNHDQIIAALRGVPVDSLGTRTEADALLAGQIPDQGLRQYLLQNLLRDEDGFRWRLNLDAIHANHATLRTFPAELAEHRYEGPSLFLSGAESDFVLPEHKPVIARYFPDAEHVVLEGARHWVHADKPAEVIGAVNDFLS